jgi:TusA-related sulfurtransferase
MKTFLGLAAMMTALALVGQEKPADDHHAAVNSRGDHAMGFSHEKTVHHFRLMKDGGTIEVSSNDPKDIESRDQIRMHLKHIAAAFSAGNFEMPMFIHDQVPPGVPVMKRLKSQIKYEVENIPAGARVRISSANPEAVKAIQDFLRFQITDHETGDPLEL